MAHFETAEIIEAPQLDTFVTTSRGDKTVGSAKPDAPDAFVPYMSQLALGSPSIWLRCKLSPETQQPTCRPGATPSEFPLP